MNVEMNSTGETSNSRCETNLIFAPKSPQLRRVNRSLPKSYKEKKSGKNQER